MLTSIQEIDRDPKNDDGHLDVEEYLHLRRVHSYLAQKKSFYAPFVSAVGKEVDLATQSGTRTLVFAAAAELFRSRCTFLALSVQRVRKLYFWG